MDIIFDGFMTAALRFFNSFIACLVSVLLVVQPVVGYAADGIVVDAGAAANRAGLDAAQNGVPIVNIVNPNSNGLSHNKFSDFNVGTQGVIINNSKVMGVSQLGGAINGNANLSNEARIILNEVTGANRSALNGATEIFGGRAEYILANPNGITCNGCGFINTPRVTLSTGAPQVVNGELYGFDVTKGDVTFEGLGFNGIDGSLALDSFDIIARTAKIATDLHVKGGLNVITGVNQVKYSDLSASVGTSSSPAPAVAIDSSALGGMYAGKIKLVATEEGVGVKTDGNLVTSAGDMVITADGQITYGNIVSSEQLTVNSKGSDVSQSGSSYAAGDMDIKASGDIRLAGDMAAAGGEVKLDAGGDIMLDGLQLQSGLVINNDGTAADSIAKGLSLKSGGVLKNLSGFMIAGGDIGIEADSLINTGGIFAQNADIATNGGISNDGDIASIYNLAVSGGDISSNGGIFAGNMQLTSSGILLNRGLLQADDSINIEAVNLDNKNTYLQDADGNFIAGIISEGNVVLSVSASASDALDNQSGLISGGAVTITAANGGIRNDSLLQSIGDMTITAVSIDNSSSDERDGTGAILKGLIAGGDLVLSASDSASVGIDNSSGAIDARGKLTITSENGLNNQAGYISSAATDQKSTLTISGSLDNDSGKILSAGDADIITNGGSNDGGIISSLKNLLFKSSPDEFVNDGGQIYAGEKLTVQNVNNDNGILQGTGGVTADNEGGILNNSGGEIRAAGQGAEVSIGQNFTLLNLIGGNIQAQANIDINIAADYSVTSDIITNDHVDITAWSVTNNSTINADDYISFTLTNGGFTNSAGAELISNTSITIDLQGAGNIDNSGEISAPLIDIDIANGNLNNNTDALITSSGALDIDVAGNITNVGRISAAGNASVDAVTLNNNGGSLSSGDTLTVTTTGNSIHNTGGSLIFAVNDINLYSPDIENSGSDIFSLDGNITMQRNIGGDKSASVTNSSGTIETLAGDITIRADALVNEKSGGGSFGLSIVDPRDGQMHKDTNGQWVIDYDVAWLDANSDEYYYNGNFGGGYNAWVFRIQGDPDSAVIANDSGFITSARDIIIDVGTLDNNYSQIAADRNITITATGNINNNSATYEEWAHWYDVNGGHWYNSFQDPNLNNILTPATVQGTEWFTTPKPKTYVVSSTIYAGNNLTMNGNSVANQGTRIGGSSPTEGVRDANAVNISISAIAADNDGSLIGGVAAGDLSYTTSPVLDTSLFADIPTHDNGLFKINTTPAANYLIETNEALIDLNRFRGSEYFLTRIGYVVPNDTKLLGDAFYETRLVRSAIFERTGQRYLTSGIGTDFAQMTALFDNAVDEQIALALTVGIELTAAQIAALSKDIIWLVEDTINGQKVLKPVIYLASATMEALSGHGSQLLAVNDIDITAADNIISGGLIKAGNDMTATATNDITNTGKIEAGQDITITSTAGSVINKAVTQTSNNGTNYITSFLQSIGIIKSGGNTTITANDNIENTASKIEAGGDLSLTATNGDVTVDTVTLHNKNVSQTKNAYSLDETVTHTASTLTAGGNTQITAGRDITISGSDVNADGNITLNAGDDVTIASVQDSETHIRKAMKKAAWLKKAFTGGLFFDMAGLAAKDETTNQTSVRTTVSGATIDAGNNLSSTSGDDTMVVASNLNAGGNVTINAGGAVGLLSAKESNYKQDTKSTESLMWQTSKDQGHSDETVVHTKINAGGNLDINAAEGIFVDIKNAGSVAESIDILAQQPGLEYLADLKNNPNVNWQKIEEAHEAWDYSAQGLTPAGAAIIAIAVAIATAGTGAAAAGSIASAATATTVTVTGAAAAAANAAMAALASQAAISLANNRGDLGKVFDDLASSDTVKNMAFAAVTAGATAGTSSMFGSGVVGQTQTAVTNSLVNAGAHSLVYGSNFGDGVVNGIVASVANVGANNISGAIGTTSGSLGANPLNTALSGLSYAAIGCAAGSMTSGNCSSGAAGSVAGSIAGSYGASYQISGLTGAVAAAVAGGDAKDVYAANSIAAGSGAAAYAASQSPVLYLNPTTGDIFNAYGQLVGTSAGIVGEVLTGASPVYASRWVDGNNDRLNESNPAPNILPGALTGKAFSQSEMGQDVIKDENGNITNFWVSNNSPALRGLNYIWPGAPSSTSFHDTGIYNIENDIGKNVGGITKAVTIPPYFLYNYYGAIGTPINTITNKVNEK